MQKIFYLIFVGLVFIFSLQCDAQTKNTNKPPTNKAPALNKNKKKKPSLNTDQILLEYKTITSKYNTGKYSFYRINGGAEVKINARGENLLPIFKNCKPALKQVDLMTRSAKKVQLYGGIQLGVTMASLVTGFTLFRITQKPAYVYIASGIGMAASIPFYFPKKRAFNNRYIYEKAAFDEYAKNCFQPDSTVLALLEANEEKTKKELEDMGIINDSILKSNDIKLNDSIIDIKEVNLDNTVFYTVLSNAPESQKMYGIYLSPFSFAFNAFSPNLSTGLGSFIKFKSGAFIDFTFMYSLLNFAALSDDNYSDFFSHPSYTKQRIFALNTMYPITKKTINIEEGTYVGKNKEKTMSIMTKIPCKMIKGIGISGSIENIKSIIFNQTIFYQFEGIDNNGPAIIKDYDVGNLNINSTVLSIGISKYQTRSLKLKILNKSNQYYKNTYYNFFKHSYFQMMFGVNHSYSKIRTQNQLPGFIASVPDYNPFGAKIGVQIADMGRGLHQFMKIELGIMPGPTLEYGMFLHWYYGLIIGGQKPSKKVEK